MLETHLHANIHTHTNTATNKTADEENAKGSEQNAWDANSTPRATKRGLTLKESRHHRLFLCEKGETINHIPSYQNLERLISGFHWNNIHLFIHELKILSTLIICFHLYCSIFSSMVILT